MTAEDYVQIIMRDDTEKFVRETPVLYENARIEREYEFEDGAVIRYEWRDISLGGFNHQFTLVKTPTHNSSELATGVIKTIDY